MLNPDFIVTTDKMIEHVIMAERLEILRNEIRSFGVKHWDFIVDKFKESRRLSFKAEITYDDRMISMELDRCAGRISLEVRDGCRHVTIIGADRLTIHKGVVRGYPGLHGMKTSYRHATRMMATLTHCFRECLLFPDGHETEESRLG